MRLTGWWLPGATMAVVLAGVLVTAMVFRSGSGADEPEFSLNGQPAEVVDAYHFVAQHPGHAASIPCYCGCVGLDHRSLLDCFVKPEGGLEPHALTCGVCGEDAAGLRAMLEDGVAIRDIRTAIDQQYGRLGRPTDTPLP
jgi:hypothetical protein